jgi:23S rRNA (cytidine1920-2'-O)/16S rRNA (cytidine1409-2'-O)-methyltransferase
MRLDIYLVDRLNIESRTKAQELIKAGKVKVNGQLILKAGHQLQGQEQVAIIDQEILRFVSRGGLKLDGALDRLHFDIKDFVVLDIGQSTGGFTDCCLQRGAQRIVGLDVGSGQLHSKLRNDARVIAFEDLHFRDAVQDAKFFASRPADGFDLVICDVSFISVKSVFPLVKSSLRAGGRYLVLVKPQFECGPSALNRSGLIRDPSLYVELRSSMIAAAESDIGPCIEYFESPVAGKDGNVEFFIFGEKS